MSLDTPHKDIENLNRKVREIMREWENLFPFPDPEDAGDEARIAFGTAEKIVNLITTHTERARIDELEMCQQVLRGGKLPVVASIFNSRIAELQKGTNHV